MNAPDLPHLRSDPAAVRNARLLHLEVDGVRSGLARAAQPEPPSADRVPAGPARERSPAADGVLIAESKPQGGGNHPIYVREYPQGVPVRQSGRLQLRRTSVRAGIELSENDLLSGEKNEFATIIDQLTNDEPVGRGHHADARCAGAAAVHAAAPGRDRHDAWRERPRRVGRRDRARRPARCG